jgi:hypothetical protein
LIRENRQGKKKTCQKQKSEPGGYEESQSYVGWNKIQGIVLGEWFKAKTKKKDSGVQHSGSKNHLDQRRHENLNTN